MAQHDYSIANQSNAALRADLNNALLAIVSGNSGGAAPSVTYAYQHWVDTGSGKYKIRNSSNTSWVTIGNLDEAGWGLAPLQSPAFSGTPTAPTAPAGTNSTQLANTAFVANAVAQLSSNLAGVLVQPGAVFPFAGGTLPSGYCLCNGDAVSRSSYAVLFSVIGTLYGVGNGSTTFNLPDLRGSFVRGLDTGRGLDPGRTLGSSQADAYRSHAHSITDVAHTHTATDSGHSHTYTGTNNNNQNAASGSGAASNSNVQSGAGTSVSYANISVTWSSTGINGTNSAGGSETRPHNVAMNWIIKN